MRIKKYFYISFFLFFFVTGNSFGTEEREKKRQLFRQAEISLRSQRLDEYNNYKNRLSDYELLPYLEYSEYQQNSPSREELEKFIDDYPLFPSLNSIKEQLLTIYYENQNWEGILRRTNKNENLCLRLLAGFHLKHDYYSLRTQAEKIWLSGKDLDELCSQILRETDFDFYQDATMVWQRLVKVYEAGNYRLARLLRSYVDSDYSHAYELWERLRRNKRRIEFYAHRMKDLPRYRAVLTYTLTHYPENHLEEGYAHYLKLSKNFTFDAKQHKTIRYYYGLYLTIDGNPLGLEVMKRIHPALLQEKEHEWRARSAVKFADWDGLLDFINHFPPYLAQNAQWLFWKGYALRKKGHYNASIRLYRQAAKDRSFYGFYAAEEAGMHKNFNYKPVTVKAGTVENRASHMRYKELIALGREAAAFAEWQTIIENSNFQQLLFLAKTAYDDGEYYLAIRTFTQAKYWDDLGRRFPVPYRSWVEQAAKKNHINVPLIYAIMRTESSYRPHVRSSAGAVGLMQILPATGQKMARKLNYADRIRLTDPATSIALGTYYLRETLSRYHGNQVLAIASYNAGPTAVNRWLPRSKSLPAVEWLETIPYGETRYYVRAIFFAQVIFQWRLNKKQISMRHFLRNIHAHY